MNEELIAKKIKFLRTEKGLSQVQLAEKLNISHQLVSKWERAESLPDIIMLSSIASYFGKDLNFFGDAVEVEKTSDKIRADYSGKVFSTSNLQNFNFDNSDLTKAKFNTSNMLNLSYKNAKLKDASFHANNMVSNDFSGADISGVSIKACSLNDAKFNDSAINDTSFYADAMHGCDFFRSALSNVFFEASSLRRCKNLKFKKCEDVSFKDCMLDDLVFESDLKKCDFIDTSIRDVVVKNAKLTECTFIFERSFRQRMNNRKLIFRIEFNGVTFVGCEFDIENFKKCKFTDCIADEYTLASLRKCGVDTTNIKAD